MKDLKGALEDYQYVLELNSNVADAQAGVKRCEQALGIVRTATSAASPSPSSSSGPGASGSAGGISEEDAKVLEEAENRMREVTRQKARAQQQQSMAAAEKRRADLTLEQLKSVDEDRAVFKSVGRMFLRAPKPDIVTMLQSTAGRAEQKMRVCASTIDYLSKQEEEADAAMLEAIATVRRKLGRA
jgi:chaperonin cofactor prefoldin